MNNNKSEMIFKTSKIRERMVEDQKNILQEKVYEYEDRLEKYRDTHGQQIKKMQEQIDKKDEKLQQLILENNSLASVNQNYQLNMEKYKNKYDNL